MSTEFFSPQLDTPGDDVRFVQFARRGTDGLAPSWEFGTVRNFREMLAMLEMGFTFEPWAGSDCGTPTTREGWIDMLKVDRVTFGTFPVTVEVGSGNVARFTMDDDA